MGEVIDQYDLLQVAALVAFLAIAALMYEGSQTIKYWWRAKRLENPKLPKVDLVAIYFGIMLVALIALPTARYLGYFGR